MLCLLYSEWTNQISSLPLEPVGNRAILPIKAFLHQMQNAENTQKYNFFFFDQSFSHLENLGNRIQKKLYHVEALLLARLWSLPVFVTTNPACSSTFL